MQSYYNNFEKQENDNIYLNVVFSHPQVIYPNTTIAAPSIGSGPVDAVYDVTKTIPVLDRCSDYYCAVVRFDIPLNSVPLFIMPILPNQSNPNKTPMILGINFNGVNYGSNLLYYAKQSPSTLPVQNQPVQVITNYYYIYSYQVLIDMMNLALLLAWNISGLEALFLPVPPSTVVVSPPFFYYDEVTKLINLVVPSLFTEVVAPATTIPIIYLNDALLYFLQSFPFFFHGYDQPFGRDYDFALTNTTPLAGIPPLFPPVPSRVFPSNNQGYALFGTTPTDPPSYYLYTQEYSVIQYWSSLRKIIITSTSIPINPEIVPVSNNLSSDISVSFPILTDFIPAIEFAGQSRAIAYYNPTSQYRLIDMTSTAPLSKISLKIYWQDLQGNLYPLRISAGQEASVKLGFFRKSLYKASKLLLNK